MYDTVEEDEQYDAFAFANPLYHWRCASLVSWVECLRRLAAVFSARNGSCRCCLLL